LGIDRKDRRDEGWYKEREISGCFIRQMQWNLYRESWESFFTKASLVLFDDKIPRRNGAKKAGVFYFGENPSDL